MGFCPVNGKECDCIVPCALPEMRLIWAHENDGTLDEWGIFLRGECIEKYEGENQAKMALEYMLRRLGQALPDGPKELDEKPYADNR